jgi:hypothetical protein
MYKKNNLLLFLTLICLVIGLLAALTPFSDIDNDGLLDSLVTEGFVLIPIPCAISGLFFLNRLSSTCLPTPLLYSSLLFTPPNSTK